MDVFRALADPTRRRLLDSLNERQGQNLVELCAGMGMARQSVSKHLSILEAANLVATIRRGREKLHYLNAAPIGEVAGRWISRYERQRVDALVGLKTALEESSVTKPEFVYKTYIRTSPEQLWRALTDPAFTRRYWGVVLTSDWKIGSPVTFEQEGVSISDPDQRVLASVPQRRLSYTWHTFTPEWAQVHGFGEDFLSRIAGERRSRVTFELEQMGETVLLTVVHDEFDEGSAVLEGVSAGWPKVLASLKSLLETDEPLTIGVGTAEVTS
jgi:uncharacterized protein YndB with AHSA1/START domain/DNA-binding transcriptional ArsR family regulator